MAEGERAERCETCRFWEAMTDAGSDPSVPLRDGLCRRLPPALPPRAEQERLDDEMIPRDGVWPMTCDNDWCGEWQPHGNRPPPTVAEFLATMPPAASIQERMGEIARESTTLNKLLRIALNYQPESP